MPQRILTDHISNITNERLIIAVLDEPGAGGACHRYNIEIPGHSVSHIDFQNGPIKEAGVNGVTHEALLAILIDRLRGFQSGAFKCRENAIALTHLEDALMWLQKRTRERVARGVEGENKP